jgi:hypothetical protein
MSDDLRRDGTPPAAPDPLPDIEAQLPLPLAIAAAEKDAHPTSRGFEADVAVLADELRAHNDAFRSRFLVTNARRHYRSHGPKWTPISGSNGPYATFTELCIRLLEEVLGRSHPWELPDDVAERRDELTEEFKRRACTGWKWNGRHVIARSLADFHDALVMLHHERRAPMPDEIHTPPARTRPLSGKYHESPAFRDALVELLPREDDEATRRMLTERLLRLLDEDDAGCVPSMYVQLAWWADDVANRRFHGGYTGTRPQEPLHPELPIGDLQRNAAARRVVRRVVLSGATPPPTSWDAAVSLVEEEARAVAPPPGDGPLTEEEAERFDLPKDAPAPPDDPAGAVQWANALSDEAQRARKHAEHALARNGLALAPTAATAGAAVPSIAPSQFDKKDWRRRSSEEKVAVVEHALALIATAEDRHEPPPSWRELEHETGTSSKTLKRVPRLAEARLDAERAAAERLDATRRRNAGPREPRRGDRA